jgi:peptidoglycan/LPS O-acetylase OafA/YrhL
MTVLSRNLDSARMGRALAPAWVLHQLAAGLGLAGAAAAHTLTGGYRGYFALGLVLSLAAALMIAPVRRPSTTRPARDAAREPTLATSTS